MKIQWIVSCALILLAPLHIGAIKPTAPVTVQTVALDKKGWSLVWQMSHKDYQYYRKEVQEKKWSMVRWAMKAKLMHRQQEVTNFDESAPIDISPNRRWLIKHGNDDFAVIDLRQYDKKQTKRTQTKIKRKHQCHKGWPTPALFEYVIEWKGAETFYFHGDHCNEELLRRYKVNARTGKVTPLKLKWRKHKTVKLPSGGQIVWKAARYMKDPRVFECVHVDAKKRERRLGVCRAPKLALSPEKTRFITRGRRTAINTVEALTLSDLNAKTYKPSTPLKWQTVQLMGMGFADGQLLGWENDDVIKASWACCGQSGTVTYDFRTKKTHHVTLNKGP